MKSNLALLLFVLGLSFNSPAQTNSWSPPKQTPRRYVNGQLYDIEKSRLWQYLDVRCERCATNGLIGYVPIHRPDGGIVRDQPVFIRNYPMKPVKSVLDQMLHFRAMRVGTQEVGECTLEAWDYGTVAP
jgi:hypothetical protein